MEKQPYVTETYEAVSGSLNFVMVNTFTPEGLVVTAVYDGNVIIYGEYVARRVYSREGPALNV